MKLEITKLLEGVKNSIWIKDEVEKIAQKRIDICNTCEHYSPNAKLRGMIFSRPDKFCTCCGCNMWLKTRSLAAKCPLGDPQYPQWVDQYPRWEAETDDKVAEEIESTPEVKAKMDEYKLKLMRHEINEQ